MLSAWRHLSGDDRDRTDSVVDRSRCRSHHRDCRYCDYGTFRPARPTSVRPEPFEHAIKSINIAAENLSASESRIRDTDMASEMAKFTKNQIMSQAGTAMLAQANQINQGVLQLLG